MNHELFETGEEPRRAAQDLRDRFLKSALELQRIGRAASFRVIPATNPELPLFQAIPFEKKRQVVEVLEASSAIYTEMAAKNLDFRNSSAVVWSALNHLNLVPPSNFFDKIGEEDVVQIYSAQGYHLFANFRFFELCSYTIEQVYSLPWPELWHRDPVDMTALEAVVGRALSEEQQETLMMSGSEHRVVEIASPFKFEMSYRVRAIAPIWDRKFHAKAGFLIVEQAKILNPPLPADEERLLNDFYTSFGLGGSFNL